MGKLTFRLSFHLTFAAPPLRKKGEEGEGHPFHLPTLKGTCSVVGGGGCLFPAPLSSPAVSLLHGGGGLRISAGAGAGSAVTQAWIYL